MVDPLGCHLFVDAGVWSAADQSLQEIRNKVTISKAGQLAVVAKGDAEFGFNIARQICKMADDKGVAATFASVGEYAANIRRSLGEFDDQRATQVLITGFNPGARGRHCTFRTHTWRDTQAYDIEWPKGSVYWCGSSFRADEMRKFDLIRKPTETDEGYARRLGTGIMNVFRFRPGTSFQSETPHIWLVGGRLDLTTIDASGAKTETLLTWPDVIGEKVDPFRGMSRTKRHMIQKKMGSPS